MTSVNRHKRISRILIVLLILASFSCTNKNNFSFNDEIEPEGWSNFYKPAFTASINDTLLAYDISISLRNSHEYPFRNIFLFVTTKSPSGLRIKDTVEYQLADEKGRWYGNGLGDLHNLTVPFKTNILFPQTGDFSFTIEQGMRREKLPGITDVGLIINQRKQEGGKE